MDGTLPLLANEIALVARAKVEPAAFAAIYDHYYPRIYAYVRYRVRDAGLTEDITAQIFERVLANLSKYDAEQAPFAVWLFTIARHRVSDHHRAQQRRHLLPLDLVRGRASADPAPEEIVVRDETREALLVAVSRLSERERDILALKFGAELTNRRIAALTGLTESNVGVILYRAVRRLRADIDAQE
jgi:RNA polymerase sigma-70 factor (ECF subfamily)